MKVVSLLSILGLDLDVSVELQVGDEVVPQLGGNLLASLLGSSLQTVQLNGAIVVTEAEPWIRLSIKNIPLVGGVVS